MAFSEELLDVHQQACKPINNIVPEMSSDLWLVGRAKFNNFLTLSRQIPRVVKEGQKCIPLYIRMRVNGLPVPPHGVRIA